MSSCSRKGSFFAVLAGQGRAFGAHCAALTRCEPRSFFKVRGPECLLAQRKINGTITEVHHADTLPLPCGPNTPSPQGGHLPHAHRGVATLRETARLFTTHY